MEFVFVFACLAIIIVGIAFSVFGLTISIKQSIKLKRRLDYSAVFYFSLTTLGFIYIIFNLAKEAFNI